MDVRENEVMRTMTLRDHADERLHDGIEVVEVGGAEEFALNLAGSLKMLLRVEPHEVEAGEAAERVRRFQAHSRSLLLAESIRATPRPVAEVLIDGFGGRALRQAWERRQVAGMIEHIDRTLAALGPAS